MPDAQQLNPLHRIDRRYILEGAAQITSKDILRTIERARDIRDKVQSAGGLQKFLADCELLISLVGDYWKRKYRDIPYYALTAAVFALLYVLTPMDLMPDFLPGVGYLDDAAVLGVCFKLIGHELERYRAWIDSLDTEEPAHAS